MVVKEPNKRLERRNVPSEVVEALQGTDWCTNLLKDDSLIPLHTLSREQKSSTEDSLIAETFRTKETIHTWQTFYKPHRSSNDTDAPIAETLTILGIGSGLNGHPQLLHGGTVAAIMDEVITFLAGRHCSSGMMDYTAYLKTDYKKPIPTPGIFLARVVLEGRATGRKQWLRGTFEDGKGLVFATTESLVVEVARDGAKL